MAKGIKVLLSIIVLAIIVLIILVSTGSQILTDWLWFDNLNFSQTFMTMFFTNLYLRLIVGLVFTVFIFINLSFTKKPLLDHLNVSKDDNVESLFGGKNDSIMEWLNKRKLGYIFLFGSIILGFLFSSVRQDLWQIVLKYINQTPFNINDPIFARDIGFYVFSLPFFDFIREMGMVLTILTLVVTGAIYTLASGISSFNEMKFKLSGRAMAHLSVLIAIFLLLKAWSYRLMMYNLLYSARGVAFGASYTDINANLIGLKILFYIVIAIAVVVLINMFKKSYRLLIWGLGFWIFASFIFGSVYPGIVQRFQVEPNEIAKESKYIDYNIDMTLKAYGLDTIEKRDFELKKELTANILSEKTETIDNIRLWDPRPLLSTYNQLQGLRPYYTFPNVDIDRYNINGEYRQVMIAGREVDQTKLNAQAKTWINQKLKYTHGYGVVMNPVNVVTPEGLPKFFIKNIPPESFTDLKINNASIYYGEMTNDYVIVNNKTKEFHYPMGSENEYYDYTGTGGVQLNSFFKKALYGLRYGNIKFLLADDIENQSRIMYYRNIKQRVRKVAPFLAYDSDPYLVTLDGRLFWIQDAYTTTNRFPYSEPMQGVGNYIRNSIKIVIDAYNGNMDYYVIDKSDPLANTYMKIFPDLFKDGEEMPENVRSHIRYPQDLFVIQSRLYSTYHMQDSTVFYNKEDIWNIPQENYAGSSIQMEPYYVIMQLPGNEENEFVLMQPFTPGNKNNMIAWMAGRSDGENYGDLILYNFPKDKLVYGPMQIESRIDQDTDISQLLTLWSQRGSRVIRGNLLVIPINDSVLYIEPIYLQAETSELPELKRVIVSYNDEVVMRETLEESIKAIFGLGEAIVETEIDDEMLEDETLEDGVRDETDDLLPTTIDELTSKALEAYQNAQESLKNGNWAEYGQYITELEDILTRLSNFN